MTTSPQGFRASLLAMLQLSAPIVFVQCGWMMMGVVDTLMVGRVSATAIAAAALGNLYFWGAAIFGNGLLMALDPLVAQAVGARDEPAIERAMQRGLLLAAVLAALASLLLVPAGPVLKLLRQREDVASLAATYARVCIAGMLPFYAFVVFRQTLQAMHKTRAIVVTIVVANLANVVFNYVLIFGKLGLPAMGVVGAAWATVASRWLMALLLLGVSWRELAPYARRWHREVWQWAPLRRMIAIGAPIGIQMQLEFGVFGVVGLLMGWIGTVELAGHQVALNLASFTFMVPLGVSAAAAVLVGQAVGRADPSAARRAALAALIIGVGFMSLSALVMLAVPRAIAHVYTAQSEVIGIAAVLIPIAGLFQVFDGIQVVSIGILRGVGDTRAPMIINVLGFWLLGLPVSWLLGLRLGQGPEGLWWGLTLGLVLVALFLAVRVRQRLQGDLSRIIVDQAPAVAD